MKSLLLIGLSAFAGLSLSACSGSSGGGGGGSGGGTATNKFSGSSRAMTAADVAPTSRTGIQTYYGSFLYKTGSDVYAGGINFTLENNGAQLYFKTFAFEKVIHYTAYNASGSQLTAGQSCFTNGTYNATTNFVNINSTANRLVNFSVDLQATCNGAGIADINNAGVIFSNDFTTMAGGDNASFFFLAQKASSQGTFTLANMDGTANLYWFDVDNSGNITTVTSNSASVTTTSGSWTTADTSGVLKLADSATGAYIYKYNHTGASSIDGGFVVTPDKNFLMGIDLVTGYYFAASR